MEKRLSMAMVKVVLVVGLILQIGCSGPVVTKEKADLPSPVFIYDQASLPKAKPWTSENS